MKRVIGITSDIGKENNYRLNESYVNAVICAGGLPVLLPVGIEEDVGQFAQMLDGLVLTGGGDIDPTLFGEEPHPKLGTVSPKRDAVEIALAREMLRLDKPILGICRGLQLLNIVGGGRMYQDIHAEQKNPSLQHVQQAPRSHPSHFVQVAQGTMLESIAKCNRFKVNSFHHQAIKDVPQPFVISATASDGIIEGIESTAHRFVVGVQWHPEELGNEIAVRLFERFIEKCKKSE